MKVFISFSGERGRGMAEALRSWLGDVHHKLEPWVATEDIEAGQRWDSELAKQLEDTACGVVCLTPDSVGAPWVHFEAGALAKAVGSSRVVPYLLGIDSDHLKAPLSQFEAVEADDKGTYKMLRGINRMLGDDRLTDDRLSRSFAKWWPDLKKALDAIPKAPLWGESHIVGEPLGLKHVFASRSEALTSFTEEFEAEIRRKRESGHGLVYFACTSMRGFLVIATETFNGKAELEQLIAGKVDLRILLTDPAVAEERARQENLTAGQATSDIHQAIKTLVKLGVGVKQIRYYNGAPSVFGIATSEAMLLNPYPYEHESHHCMTLVVSKTNNKHDVFHQYTLSHFVGPWEHGAPIDVNAIVGVAPPGRNHGETDGDPSNKQSGTSRREGVAKAVVYTPRSPDQDGARPPAVRKKKPAK